MTWSSTNTSFTFHVGICIAVREKIPYPADNKTFEMVISKLLADKQARVVIVFCSKKETITSLLQTAKAQNAVDKFQWIGSDAWITVSWLGELQPLVRGLISVQPTSNPVKGFQDYLLQRMITTSDVNRGSENTSVKP
jgi:ABC-type branched-subunit amino acid transport system substrate-binding protein